MYRSLVVYKYTWMDPCHHLPLLFSRGGIHSIGQRHRQRIRFVPSSGEVSSYTGPFLLTSSLLPMCTVHAIRAIMISRF